MALSATFTANFSSFYDAVEKAGTKLVDFGQGAEKVGGKLDRMVDNFSGRKLIQEATMMARAVEDVGGVSTLTDKELKKLGGTVGEAVEKMQKLGMDVPANLQAIADKTKSANQQTSEWTQNLGKLAAAAGLAFSVDSLKNFVGSVFDAASTVKDLSDQWGIGTEAVQRFIGGAKQSGVEAASIGKNIQYLTEKLAENSEEYDALLANVGLAGDALRKLPMEEVYRQVIGSLAGIKDHTLQLDASIGLLGPSAKQSIGAIRDGLLENAAAQVVMTDETIANLERAQASWEKFFDFLTVGTGTALGTVMSLATRVTSSWDGLGKVFNAAIGRMLVSGGSLGEVLIDVDKGLERVDLAARGSAAAMNVATTSENELIPKVKTHAEIVADLKKKHDALTAGLKATAEAEKAVQKATDDYNKAVQTQKEKTDALAASLSGADLVGKAQEYMLALQSSIPIQQMTAEKQKEIGDVMLAAMKVYEAAGVSVPAAMVEIWMSTKNLDREILTSTADVIAYGKAWEEMVTKTGGLPAGLPGDLPDLEKPADPKIASDKAAKDAEKRAREQAQAIRELVDSLGMFAEALGGKVGAVVDEIGKMVAAMQTAEDAGSKMHQGLAAFSAGEKMTGMTNMASGAVQLAGSFLKATEGAGKLKSTMTGAAMGFSVAGPWGAAVGAGIGLIRGFFNAAKEKRELRQMRDNFIEASGGITELTIQARDAGVSLDALLSAGKKADVEAAIGDLQKAFAADKLRDDFVEAAGGVDALTAQAEKAGVSVDALFSAKSAEAVNASIKEIQEALQFQQDAYQLAIETAEKYGFTIEELGPAMARQELDKQAQQLFQDWEVLNAAGIDTIKITEKMSKSVNEYLSHARHMGAEVPEAMRPMLEQMAKSGQLLDENGKAVDTLEQSGVTFAMSMSDGFKGVIKTVEKLTDAISRSLGLAIKEVPDVKVRGSVEWSVPPVPAPPSSGGGDSEPPGFARGTKGFQNFGTGTPVILHGWEAVVPKDNVEAFATVAGAGSPSASAGGSVSIVVNAQGAFFDTPASLQQLATKVSDALTAKYSVMGKLRAAV